MKSGGPASASRHWFQVFIWNVVQFPLLFAVYQVVLGVALPEDVGEILKFTTLMCLLTIGTSVLWSIGSARTSKEPKSAISGLVSEWKLLLWGEEWKRTLKINILSLAGPPLWFFAIGLTGAVTAAWVDLGATPIITILLALKWHPDEKPSSGWGWAAIAAYAAALIAALWAPAINFFYVAGSGLLVWVGILAAAVSGYGTAAAGKHLKALRSERREVSVASLMASRYLLSAVVLVGAWMSLSAGGRTSGGLIPRTTLIPKLWGQSSWDVLAVLGIGLPLYVMPNARYLVILGREKLKYAGFMWATMPVLISFLQFAIINSSLREKMGWAISDQIMPWEWVIAATALMIIGTWLDHLDAIRYRPLIPTVLRRLRPTRSRRVTVASREDEIERSMVRVPTNIKTFASNRETSGEIAMAIFEVASEGDEERMWKDPTGEELQKVVALAWELADHNTNRLHWGLRTFEWK
jgi:YccJ-like protein